MGLSWEALLTTTIHGRLPGLARARMMSSKSPLARGSPPETLTTGAPIERQMRAYPSGSSRLSLMGPPQLQCQQFAVQAWVISKETVSGFFRNMFHAPRATILTAIVLGTFMRLLACGLVVGEDTYASGAAGCARFPRRVLG